MEFSLDLIGSHMLPDGSCCHCGPKNAITGPRWACNCPESSKEV